MEEKHAACPYLLHSSIRLYAMVQQQYTRPKNAPDSIDRAYSDNMQIICMHDPSNRRCIRVDLRTYGVRVRWPVEHARLGFRCSIRQQFKRPIYLRTGEAFRMVERHAQSLPHCRCGVSCRIGRTDGTKRARACAPTRSERQKRARSILDSGRTKFDDRANLQAAVSCERV